MIDCGVLVTDDDEHAERKIWRWREGFGAGERGGERERGVANQPPQRAHDEQLYGAAVVEMTIIYAAVQRRHRRNHAELQSRAAVVKMDVMVAAVLSEHQPQPAQQQPQHLQSAVIV